MKVFRSKLAAGFTLVEIMIVVLIIGILLAIAIPNFVKARETSRTQACVANLKQIDSAIQQYMMDNKLSTFTTATQSANGADIGALGTNALTLGTTPYLRNHPACPSGGLYTTNDGTTSKPTCSVGGTHIMPQ